MSRKITEKRTIIDPMEKLDELVPQYALNKGEYDSYKAIVDKEKELIKEIKERISSLDVRDDIERRAYEIALVSLEVEPDEREAYELFMKLPKSIKCRSLRPSSM